MKLIHLEAKISDIVDEDNLDPNKTIKDELEAMLVYFRRAFRLVKTEMTTTENHVYYILTPIQDDHTSRQIEAILEILGMFTMFNATIRIEP